MVFFPVIIPVYNFYYRLCYVTIIKLVKIMGFRFFSFFRTIFITLRDGNVIIRQFRNIDAYLMYIYIYIQVHNIIYNSVSDKISFF